MRIEQVKTRAVDIGQGFRWGGRSAREVIAVHLQLLADDGTPGHAVAWTADLPPAAVVAGVEHAIKPLLEGADPFQRGAVLARAWGAFRVGMPFPAIGLADVAMWDLCGQATGRSISELAGRQQQRLKGCASAPPVSDPADAAAMTAELLDEGFKAIKLHACGDVQADIAVCEAVRDAAGESVDLMMDAMGIYGRHTAARLGQCLDDLEYRWYEDPLSDRDLEGWRELRGAVQTPLAGVDAVRFTTNEYARPVAEGAFDIVRMDAARNGISQLSALARLAEAFGVGCEGHAFGPALAQAANLQAGLSAESARYCELPVPLGALDYGVISGLTLDAEGYVRAPDGPGLGLEVDVKALDEAVVPV